MDCAGNWSGECMREEGRFNQVDQEVDLVFGEMAHELTASTVDDEFPVFEHGSIIWIEPEAGHCKIGQEIIRGVEGP